MKKFIKSKFDRIIFSMYTYVYKVVEQNRPKRIILIRHGQSIANLDETVYECTPDCKIALSVNGERQAYEAGVKLKKLIGEESVTFYVSPFLRTRQTYDQIVKQFDKNKHLLVEDPRIREQERGNYQKMDNRDKVWHERDDVGLFFYRYEGGESVADVYDRCSSFLETLFRFENIGKTYLDNKIIISHGGFMRLFIMRYYKLKVPQFEAMNNPENCGMWVMERRDDGSYKLIPELEKLQDNKKL